jgi:hypothetical protein
MSSPVKCPKCGKSFKGGINPARQHFAATHDGVWTDPVKRNVKQMDDDEPSMADLAVQAELDRAMGIENPDIEWLCAACHGRRHREQG